MSDKKIDICTNQGQKNTSEFLIEMRPMRSKLSLVLLSSASALFLLSFEGCTPRIDQHGKVLEAASIQQLQVGKQNKDEVLKLLGSPTSTDIFDQNVWFYDSKRTETTSFFLPETLMQRTLLVRFDQQGIIDVLKFVDENKKDIQMVERETEIVEPEESILEQIFGSFSRFNEREEKPK